MGGRHRLASVDVRADVVAFRVGRRALLFRRQPVVHTCRRPHQDPHLALAVVITGVLVSRIGDSAVALGLVLDAAHGSSTWLVAAVYLAELLPPILFAPLLGGSPTPGTHGRSGWPRW